MMAKELGKGVLEPIKTTAKKTWASSNIIPLREAASETQHLDRFENMHKVCVKFYVTKSHNYRSFYVQGTETF